MQNNIITLTVDKANDGNTVPVVFSRNEEYSGRSVYIGENHRLDARDTLVFYRTMPTASGNFKGMAKTAVKFSRDLSVPGVDSSTSLTVPLIIEATVSLPVGAAKAELVEARQKLIALLDDDSIMNPLNTQLSI